MSIETCTANNETLLFNIQGEMTIYSAREQHSKIIAEVQNSDHQSVHIDLSDVEEIDTSGIQILLALKEFLNERGKQFNIIKLSQAVKNVVDIYNIDTDLSIAKTIM